MKVRDNGKGFDPEAVNKGDGLRYMQRRAHDINESLTMEYQGGISDDLIFPGFEK